MRGASEENRVVRVRAMLREAKERRVFRAAAAYVVAFFGLTQVAGVLLPGLGLPEWSVTLFIAFGILGFPLAIGLAWAFDLTSGGLQRTPGAGSGLPKAAELPQDQGIEGGRSRPHPGPAAARAAPPEPDPSGPVPPPSARASRAQAWARTRQILDRAVELRSADREAYLDRECAADPRLRREVDALLRAHEAPGPLDRLSSEVMAPLIRPLRHAVFPPSSGFPPVPPFPVGSPARPQRSPAPASPGQAPPERTGTPGRSPSDRRLRPEPSPFDPQASPESERASRYEIQEELGSGGMGVVYRARDTALGRPVALKFLPPRSGTDGAARERFLLEARSAAALDHPNICTIHEVGETADGGLFIAMPLYGGETLDSRLAKGALEWEEAVEIAVQVARGLARAHEAGIVHRDIKPANLCLTREGAVKILDFGIAKVADSPLTGSGRLLGTASYMSPEQARGEEVDARTDLWSLGVVLYEMLTGERLFGGSGRDAVLTRIRSDEPLGLGRLRGTAPATVVQLVERLLSRSAEERPPSAGAVAAGLTEAASRGPMTEEEPDTTGDLAPEGERRQVTIVVSALAEYSTLVERLAPDELENTLDRFRSATREIVERHGGTLNEFTGEGCIAVFGVPVTHEDDSARASRAALELRRLGGLGGGAADDGALPLQCGVGAGTVVAQRLESGERAYRLAGAPAQLASRLAARADPGEILLDARIVRSAGEGFAFARSTPLASGEGDTTLEVVRLEGLRAEPHPEEGREAGATHLTAFIGRERELGTLLAGFRKASSGHGELITVVGDAGTGKSRLLHEFRRAIRTEGGEGGPVAIRGHCPSDARSRPYLPFVEVIMSILGLAEVDGAPREEEVIERLRRVSPDLEPFGPLFLHLLSVPSHRLSLPRTLQGEQLRAAMREAIAALVTLASEHHPLVLLLEDWHWTDEASDEALRQLAGIISSFSVLVVVTYRPGYRTEWDGSQERTLVQLGPLDAGAAARMLEAILDVPALPEEVAANLHHRAGGNPFFLEELCQSLEEAGMIRVDEGNVSVSGAPERLHLPTTIQGVIRTRLDRLPADVRAVIRSAAVLGREFSLPLLQRLGLDHYQLTRALATLRSTGIIQQTRVVPHAAFRFKHVLTQEVAYDTLLHHQRKVLHGKAGRAIEDFHRERRDEFADRLAHHFSEAEDWDRAIHYGLASAARARAMSEFSDALTALESVEEWLSRTPDDEHRRELEITTYLQQEEICETLGRRGRQQEVLDRVYERLDPESDRHRLAEVHRRRGDVYTLLQRFEEARASLDSALELAREAGDLALEGNVLRSLGLTGWHQRLDTEALAWIEEALRIDRERGDAEALTADLNNKAQILKDRGDHEGALACLEEALALAARTGNPLKKSYTLHMRSNVHRARGELDEALRTLEEARDLTTREHLPIQRSFHLTAIAHIHLIEGRIDEAVARYEESVAVARRARYAEGLAQSLRPLGELLAGIGREAEALPLLQEAATLFGQLGNPDREADVWRKAAGTAERLRRFEAAEEAWARCAELARVGGLVPEEIEALEGIARAQREIGETPEQARRTLSRALELARKEGETRREASLRNSLGILEWQRGAHSAARAHYEEALALFRNLGDESHEGLILNSLGATLRASGDAPGARRRLEEAVRAHRRTGQRLLEGHALALLGELDLDADDPDTARARFEASLEIRRALEDARGEAWMMEALGRVHAQSGRPAEAMEQRASARQIARKLADAELLAALEE